MRPWRRWVVDTPPEVREAYGLKAAAPDDAAADGTDWQLWVDAQDFLPPPYAASPGSMIYTSGTTGRPKGVRRVAPTSEQLPAIIKTLSQVMGFSLP